MNSWCNYCRSNICRSGAGAPPAWLNLHLHSFAPTHDFTPIFPPLFVDGPKAKKISRVQRNYTTRELSTERGEAGYGTFGTIEPSVLRILDSSRSENSISINLTLASRPPWAKFNSLEARAFAQIALIPKKFPSAGLTQLQVSPRLVR